MEPPIFALSKWKDIKLEDFYHPSYQFCLKIFTDFTFACSTFFYIFSTYIILTQSTSKMATFKTTILMQITFNFIYEFSIFLFNPILHFPLIFISFNGFFNIEKRAWRLYIMAFFFFLVVGGIVAFITSLIQRVESVFTVQWNEKRHFRFTLFVHFFATSFVSATFFVPLYMLFGEDLEENMKNEVPALYHLYHFLPTTIGVDPSQNPSAIMTFLIICSFWIIIFVIAFSGLNIIFILKLRQIKSLMSKETYALQKMLHRTLIIQMIAAVCLVLIPMLILIGGVVCQDERGSWIVNLALPISSVHMCFDCPCVLYFIKPYRNFIWKLLGKKNPSSLIVVTPIVSQQQPTSFA